MSTTYTDLLYKEEKGVATITINRPKVMNAFNAHTVEELIQAFLKAGWDKKIGVIVLTGTGDRAFCTGGDQSATSAATKAAAPTACRSRSCSR